MMLFFSFTKKRNNCNYVCVCVSLLLVLFFPIKFIVYNFCTHAHQPFFIIVARIGHRAHCNTQQFVQYTMPFWVQFLWLSFCPVCRFFVLFPFYLFLEFAFSFPCVLVRLYLFLSTFSGNAAACACVVFPLILIKALLCYIQVRTVLLLLCAKTLQMTQFS